MRHSLGNRNLTDELCYHVRADRLVDEKLTEPIGHGLTLGWVNGGYPLRKRAIEVPGHVARKRRRLRLRAHRGEELHLVTPGIVDGKRLTPSNVNTVSRFDVERLSGDRHRSLTFRQQKNDVPIPETDDRGLSAGRFQIELRLILGTVGGPNGGGERQGASLL